MINEKRTTLKIRAYCEKATEAPWSEDLRRLLYEFGMRSADTIFIINARTDLPDILELAVKLRTALYRAYMTGYTFGVEELLSNTKRLDDGSEARLKNNAEIAWRRGIAEEEANE